MDSSFPNDSRSHEMHDKYTDVAIGYLLRIDALGFQNKL